MTEFLSSFGIQLLLAVVLDFIFGEISRFHPLVGFGNFARRVESCFYPKISDEFHKGHFSAGVIAWLVTVLPLVLASWVLADIPVLGWFFEVAVLYFAIGGNSLTEHARSVSRPLFRGNLEEAREKVGWIVSRETKDLPKGQVIRATIESVLENGNDAVFGALFWFLIAGAPGVVLYRLVNTLDAMWGYKNEKYLFFGRAAARLDDLLNWIPARLTALTYTFQGNWRQGLHCWQTQSGQYKSSNGGAVMAAGAGCLGFTLGGKAVYHGKEIESPVLGAGREPEVLDIERSIDLVFRGTWYWVGICLMISLFL